MDSDGQSRRGDLGMQMADAVLELAHLGFDLGRPELVGEFQAEGDDGCDGARCTVQMPLAWAMPTSISLREPGDRIDDALVGRLADEKALGFPRQHHCDDGEDQADEDGGHAVENGKIRRFTDR